MKLSLNLPALERLLAGNSELEIELRHQVIKNFAKGHLSCLINEEFSKILNQEMTVVRETILGEIRKEIASQVGYIKNDTWGYLTAELTAKIKQLVDSHVTKMVQEQIQNTINFEAQGRVNRWQEWVDKKVELALRDNIKQQIDKGIKERLEKAANDA